MKFMTTKKKSSGPATNCSQPFRSQEEGNFVVKKKRIQQHQGNVCCQRQQGDLFKKTDIHTGKKGN